MKKSLLVLVEDYINKLDANWAYSGTQGPDGPRNIFKRPLIGKEKNIELETGQKYYVVVITFI